MSDELERPNRGAFDSSTVWRINSTAWKVNEAFNKARREARDECLWLSNVCGILLEDNDRLRIANEKLTQRLEKLERTE